VLSVQGFVGQRFEFCNELYSACFPLVKRFYASLLISFDVKIPVRSRGWAVRSKKLTLSSGASTLVGNSSFYTQSPNRFHLQRPIANTSPPVKITGKK